MISQDHFEILLQFFQFHQHRKILIKSIPNNFSQFRSYHFFFSNLVQNFPKIQKFHENFLRFFSKIPQNYLLQTVRKIYTVFL